MKKRPAQNVPQKKKKSKTRLLCVSLSESLLNSAKKYRRQNGFSSMSELLRAAAEHKVSVLSKKKVEDPKKQVSFRLSDALYMELLRAASQSAQSVSSIIRKLLENAPKLKIRPRPLGVPAVAKKAVPAAKAPAKTVPAKKVSAKKKAVPAKKKVAPAAKKPVPAKKKSSRKK